MKLLPLAAIGLNPRSHLSALWWLGLLYRRPKVFVEALGDLPSPKEALIWAALYLHAAPHIVIAAVVGRLVLFGLLGAPMTTTPPNPLDALAFHAIQVAQGVTGGIAVGVFTGAFFGRAGIHVAIALGITVGLACGVGFGIALGIDGGIFGAMGLDIAVGIAVGIVAGIVAGIAVGIALGIAGGIAGGIASLRAFYHPFHLPFVWPVVRGRWYRFHPVAWDDLCSIPFWRLDRLLLAYAEVSRTAAEREIERLISGYPSQRMQALRARAALVARDAGSEHNLVRLDLIVSRLPEGTKGFLAETPRVREMVAELCRQQARLDTLDRPLLREPMARALRGEIENFYHRLAGFREPLASEFRKAAQKWLRIAGRQWEEARAVLDKEPTPQVFRAGDPVDRSQEAFVLRGRVLGNLERQVMLSTGCPGVLLYGRRRMGKSTILRNLVGLIPPTVRVKVISMQNPEAFQSIGDFLGLVAREVRAMVPECGKGGEPPADLAALFALLAECNRSLADAGARLLVALDEYENIDEKIGQRVFDKDLLATLRESIQSHRQLTWVFAGSHEIGELGHAPWPSYLVSVRTIEVLPFTPEETHLLLTEPLKHSPMWRDDEARRPRFEPAFWGPGGIERIHAEAAGWPHLVQLIAERTVDVLNDSQARQVTPEILEEALDAAVVGGDVVLRQLMERECSLPGEWEYLRGFSREDVQEPSAEEAVRRALLRRLVVAEDGGQWRLRVPLMQRWLRARG